MFLLLLGEEQKEAERKAKEQAEEEDRQRGLPLPSLGQPALQSISTRLEHTFVWQARLKEANAEEARKQLFAALEAGQPATLRCSSESVHGKHVFALTCRVC